MKKDSQGFVKGIFRSPADDPDRYDRLSQIDVTLEGLAGDRHSGLTIQLKHRRGGYPAGAEVRNTRQISIISCEDLRAIADALSLPEIAPELMKTNLLLEGIPNLSLLPPGTRLVFSGGVGLVIDGHNAPCMDTGQRIQAAFPDREKLAAQFVKAAHLRRGSVAWVERAGEIKVGDTVQVYLPNQPDYPESN